MLQKRAALDAARLAIHNPRRASRLTFTLTIRDRSSSSWLPGTVIFTTCPNPIGGAPNPDVRDIEVSVGANGHSGWHGQAGRNFGYFSRVTPPLFSNTNHPPSYQPPSPKQNQNPKSQTQPTQQQNKKTNPNPTPPPPPQPQKTTQTPPPHPPPKQPKKNPPQKTPQKKKKKKTHSDTKHVCAAMMRGLRKIRWTFVDRRACLAYGFC